MNNKHLIALAVGIGAGFLLRAQLAGQPVASTIYTFGAGLRN